MNNPDVLSAALGHSFADPDLLTQALTHSSVADGKRSVAHNESLEFLGDRVLGLLVAERLYRLNPRAKEGELARALNAAVNRDACAAVARAAGLDAALRLSKSEVRTGGREKPTILGDVTEAVLAALYLDGGLDAARQFFDRYWADLSATVARDPKTALQEWAQGQGYAPPTYTLQERTGPDHAPMFTVAVHIADLPPELGQGPSKQAAERLAAAAFLERVSS